MTFGGFSNHLAPNPSAAGGALGALALGLASGGGVPQRGPKGHILEGAVGIADRRKRSSAGELHGSLGEGHMPNVAFSGRDIFDLFSVLSLVDFVTDLLHVSRESY